jgi:hypothetical protein
MFVITANTIGVPSPPILTRRTVGTTFLFGGASSTNLGGGSNGVASRVTQSVSAANAAIAAGANNRIVGILWGQGEADATMSAARYQSELIDLINYFRANITGATNCPFVIGGMVPEWVATSTQAQQIDSVHRNLPASASVLRVGFADPPIGSADPTPFHYDAPSARRLGAQYYLGWLRAVGNTVSGFPAQPTSVEATAVTSSSISISWARPTSGVTRITSWLIRRRIAGGGVWTNTTAVFSATTATITGLSPNTQYEIQVIGVNAQGNGTPSNTLLATTSP